MNEIDLLKKELDLMFSCVEWVKEYQILTKNSSNKPYPSLVLEKLKYRAEALTQRLTLINQLTVETLFK